MTEKFQVFEPNLRGELNRLRKARETYRNDSVIMTPYERMNEGEKIDALSQNIGASAVRQASAKWNNAVNEFVQAEQMLKTAKGQALKMNPDAVAEMQAAQMEVATATSLEDLQAMWQRTRSMSRESIIARSNAIMKKALDFSSEMASGLDSRRQANSLFNEVKNTQDSLRYSTKEVELARMRIDKASKEIMDIRPLVAEVGQTFRDYDLLESLNQIQVTRKVNESNPLELIETIEYAPPKGDETIKAFGGGKLASGKNSTMDFSKMKDE